MMQPAPPGSPQATPTTAPQQHQPEASAASAAATTTSAADASSGSQGSTAASSSPAPPPQPPPPPRVQNGAAAAAAATAAAAAADDGGASSDYESANSEDDFAEIEPSQFSSFVVIFGSRKKAHIRAKEKAHGTQWDCDDCSQPNSILDYVCTACGMMDLDLLELGDGEAVSEMRRAAAEERQKAEETKRREEEERARKERAARIAKSKSLQQKRSNLANLQNKMEDMKKLLKQKEQQKQQRTTTGGPESPLHPSSGPCTPVKTAQAGASGPGAGGAGTAGGSGAGGGAGSGAASGGSAVGGGGGGGTSSFANVSPSPVPELSTPTKREAVTEGPALPPHLLAARRAREAPSAGNDATPPRDGPISAPPSLKDDDDRRDRRRRRSDSEEKGRTRRSERDRHSDRDRRRRGDDPRDRDHARDRVGSDKARRPSGGGIEGLKNLITSTVGGSGGGGGGGTGSSSDVHSPADSSASNRLSSGGVKRMLSPDARDGKVRKVETPKGVPSTLGTARTSKLRMDAYGGGDGYDREKRDEKRERSDSPPVKRGRGASKWTGAGTTAAGAATGAASAAGSSGAGGRREEGDSSVAMVTCASGRKIFQPKRLGGDGLDERGGAKLPLSVAALSPAGSGGAGAAAGATSGNSPLSAAASLQHGPLSSAAPAAGDGRDVWREKLAGVNLDGAEELAPGHDVLQCSGGVVNFIATHGGRRAFVNPYTEGVINAYASSTASGHISAVLTPKFSAEGTFATGWPETGRSSFIAFDFCDYEVLPTQYTLGHAWEHPQNYIRSWSLRASEDNYKWDILAKHSNDDSIQEGHEVATFKLVPQETLKFYRYFMIRMEPKGNSRRNGQLVASCFELYGHCRKASRRT